MDGWTDKWMHGLQVAFPDEGVWVVTCCSFCGQDFLLNGDFDFEVEMVSVLQFTYLSVLSNKISYVLFIICFVKC